MALQPTSSALRALALEYKSLQEEPVEGFRVKLVNDDNLFEWEVAIFGPPDTLYQGGYFKAHMKFPPDYPYSPPSIRFLTKVWHPNVYENGDLCISILHPPVDDPQSGELPCERWNPTQNVRTILLSVISLLNEPNTFSPANVDASVMYRRWRGASDRDKEYENIIRKQVAASRLEADKDNVVVPITLEDYCIKTKVKPTENSVDMTDFYDDDYDLDDDEDSDLEDDDDGGLDSGGCADDGSVGGTMSGAGVAGSDGTKGVVSGNRLAVEGSYEDGDDSGNGET
ncbi:ubiquitin-conjugating enzyme E2 R2 [Hetaerina americana]|uniref:ubiquitin-conjugating enzyme E2 R2 n=1 Tax=Hetaerina americana TaxID=62018 RepID=UPI003A7F2951